MGSRALSSRMIACSRSGGMSKCRDQCSNLGPERQGVGGAPEAPAVALGVVAGEAGDPESDQELGVPGVPGPVEESGEEAHLVLAVGEALGPVEDLGGGIVETEAQEVDPPAQGWGVGEGRAHGDGEARRVHGPGRERRLHRLGALRVQVLEAPEGQGRVVREGRPRHHPGVELGGGGPLLGIPGQGPGLPVEGPGDVEVVGAALPLGDDPVQPLQAPRRVAVLPVEPEQAPEGLLGIVPVGVRPDLLGQDLPGLGQAVGPEVQVGDEEEGVVGVGVVGEAADQAPVDGDGRVLEEDRRRRGPEVEGLHLEARVVAAALGDLGEDVDGVAVVPGHAARLPQGEAEAAAEAGPGADPAEERRGPVDDRLVPVGVEEALEAVDPLVEGRRVVVGAGEGRDAPAGRAPRRGPPGGGGRGRARSAAPPSAVPGPRGGSPGGPRRRASGPPGSPPWAPGRKAPPGPGRGGSPAWGRRRGPGPGPGGPWGPPCGRRGSAGGGARGHGHPDRRRGPRRWPRRRPRGPRPGRRPRPGRPAPWPRRPGSPGPGRPRPRGGGRPTAPGPASGGPPSSRRRGRPGWRRYRPRGGPRRAGPRASRRPGG